VILSNENLETLINQTIKNIEMIQINRAEKLELFEGMPKGTGHDKIQN
jgi:hypothetical protein